MNLLSAALILLGAAILFVAYGVLTLARSIEVFGNQLTKFGRAVSGEAPQDTKETTAADPKALALLERAEGLIHQAEEERARKDGL